MGSQLCQRRPRELHLNYSQEERAAAKWNVLDVLDGREADCASFNGGTAELMQGECGDEALDEEDAAQMAFEVPAECTTSGVQDVSSDFAFWVEFYSLDARRLKPQKIHWDGNQCYDLFGDHLGSFSSFGSFGQSCALVGYDYTDAARWMQVVLRPSPFPWCSVELGDPLQSFHFGLSFDNDEGDYHCHQSTPRCTEHFTAGDGNIPRPVLTPCTTLSYWFGTDWIGLPWLCIELAGHQILVLFWAWCVAFALRGLGEGIDLLCSRHRSLTRWPAASCWTGFIAAFGGAFVCNGWILEMSTEDDYQAISGVHILCLAKCTWFCLCSISGLVRIGFGSAL